MMLRVLIVVAVIATLGNTYYRSDDAVIHHSYVGAPRAALSADLLCTTPVGTSLASVPNVAPVPRVLRVCTCSVVRRNDGI